MSRRKRGAADRNWRTQPWAIKRAAERALRAALRPPPKPARKARAVAEYTAAWRKANALNAERALLAEIDGTADEAYIAMRVCRDFAGIMFGYCDLGDSRDGNRVGFNRFADPLFHSAYWA